MIIDSHCHLDFPVFDNDRYKIINDCRQLGISNFIVPSIKCSRWKNLFELSNKHREIIPAIGLHPYFIKEHELIDLDLLEQEINNNPLLLIGETGLDFYRKDLDIEKQKKFFAEHLAMAREYKRTIIIHARKSHEQVIAMIKASGVQGGIIHAFNGSYEQAKQYMKYDFKFGFGGAMTYNSATKLRKLVTRLPLNSILLETDAPDMRPGFISKEENNSPIYLPKILDVIFELRKESPFDIEEQLFQNTQKIIT